MKKFSSLFVVVAALVSLAAFSAYADDGDACLQGLPPGVALAVTYASLVQNGGTGLLDPVESVDMDPEHLCRDLKSYNTQPSSHQEGYLETTLDLTIETCVVSMKPVGNQFDDFYLRSCVSN